MRHRPLYPHLFAGGVEPLRQRRVHAAGMQFEPLDERIGQTGRRVTLAAGIAPPHFGDDFAHRGVLALMTA